MDSLVNLTKVLQKNSFHIYFSKIKKKRLLNQFSKISITLIPKSCNAIIRKQYYRSVSLFSGFAGDSVGKESACNAGDTGDAGSFPRSG